MSKAKWPVIIVITYVIVFIVLLNTGFSLGLIPYLFFAFPFLLMWMVYRILKDIQYKYPELGPKDEWGYRDKKKDELGLF